MSISETLKGKGSSSLFQNLVSLVILGDLGLILWWARDGSSRFLMIISRIWNHHRFY